MVNHPPLSVFAGKDVGRDQKRVLDLLPAKDIGNIAEQVGGGIATDDLW